jgi:hypothetical protein
MFRISLSCLTAMTALLLSTGTAKGGVEPEPFSPLLGGGAGQTLRITITGTGATCQATLGFRDAKGIPIPDDGRVRTVTLKEGESAFHELNFNPFVNRLRLRYEVRAVVTQDPAVPSSCHWSAEIYDQFSKRTTLIYAPIPDDGLPVPDDGHLPPIGWAFGQTVRLGVVASPVPDDGRPAAPCEGQAILHSATGAVLASKELKLASGQGDFLDLNMNGLVRFGERGIINPCFMPVALGSAGGCKVSIQVFDNLTGWTQAFLAPVF